MVTFLGELTTTEDFKDAMIGMTVDFLNAFKSLNNTKAEEKQMDGIMNSVNESFKELGLPNRIKQKPGSLNYESTKEK